MEVKLTESSRPVLIPNEVIIKEQSKVEVLFEYFLCSDSKQGEYYCYLTSHRLVCVSKKNFAIPLAYIEGQKAAGGFLRTHRIEFNVRIKALPQYLHEYMPQALMPSMISMKFTVGGRDEFLTQIDTACRAESWNKPIIVEQKQIKVEGYGIGGIKQALKEDTHDRNQTLSAGFKDLKSLSDKSRELKNLASKLKQMDESKDPELQEIKATMASMGFTSGVTKETAGKNYIPQLARELCDFIKEPLQNNGGLLPLLDAYCIYNRARGGSVISPSDMAQACELFESLSLPIKIRVLAGGTKALSLGGQAVENLTRSLIEKIREVGHLSSKEAAEIFKISTTIALECLLLGENQGQLCRDQGLQGLHFYYNLFLRN
ncbi:hypothetical protein SteCoe_26746 [Stentor coeruleus]|uniref:Vacuolar protein-sorting-associated protein 36 n=1 Tax=Stentor coeruleus TaxID=5963 RepID=A0A1R2BC59_9CILI|nr:hypothetical protein SteCoe_26746 [Stentor coeruleus]